MQFFRTYRTQILKYINDYNSFWHNGERSARPSTSSTYYLEYLSKAVQKYALKPDPVTSSDPNLSVDPDTPTDLSTSELFTLSP